MAEKKVYTLNDDGFYTNYTKEDCLRAGQELKESGTCPIRDPEFYGLWKWDDPNQVKDEETKRLNRERRLKVSEETRRYYSYRENRRRKKYKGGTQ